MLKGREGPRRVPGRSWRPGGAQAAVHWVLTLFSCLSLAGRPHPKAFISNKNTAIMTFKAQGRVTSPTHLGGFPCRQAHPGISKPRVKCVQRKKAEAAEAQSPDARGWSPGPGSMEASSGAAARAGRMSPPPGPGRGQERRLPFCPHLLCDLALQQAGQLHCRGRLDSGYFYWSFVRGLG